MENDDIRFMKMALDEAKKAMEMTGMKRSSFYKLVRITENR